LPVSPILPIAPVLPVVPILPVGPVPLPPIPIPNPVPTPPIAVPIPLTPTNPSTTTAAPNSSVAVTVPNQSGTVTFSLVVTDNLGIASQAATVSVTIQGPPVAKLSTTTPVVAPGGTIQLSGDGSVSTGSLSTFKFSLSNPIA